MDMGEDWHEDLQPAGGKISPWSANLICYSDGGTRQGSCSGAAWILEAHVLEDGLPQVRPIARGGKYISLPVSSFFFEAIALDEATSHLFGILNDAPQYRIKRARAHS